MGSRPVCNSASRYAVSLSTASGSAIKDAIINAQGSGLSVSVAGTGKCTAWGDSEDIGTIAIAGTKSITISNPVTIANPNSTTTAVYSVTCASANNNQGNRAI